VLIKSFNGGDPIEIKDKLREAGVLPKRETWECTGTFEFRDENQTLLYSTERLEHPSEPKRYVAKLPNGSMKIGSVRRVLYRLPELIAADPGELVFLPEGERKADKLARWGLVATAFAFGAKGWRKEYAQQLAGRTVVLLPDNDDEGRAMARRAARDILAAGGEPRILALTGLPVKGDIMEWSGTRDELVALAYAEPSADLPADEPPGAGKSEETAARSAKTKPASQTPGGADPSEDDIALAFTDRHRESLRFDHDLGLWLEWDGARWRPDNRHRAFTYARTIARQHGAAGKANFASGVERFARADPVHAVNSDIWDADPMLLGTPGGVIDLRTGRLQRARPDTFMTKLTSCTPDSSPPELWLRFLKEALADDDDAIRFLKLWAGYCLTGDTREHALIFLHGLAGTGKSVFLNTLAAILGDYAVTAPMETFTASKFDRHSTELAMLKGARLVTASETEEGRQWAEARIKQITGGDPITARFMRQDNFTFRPQFKLTIVGNHAPRLTNPDDAMRRRFNILGFNIKPHAPDLQLEEKLRAEHPRILAWAIEGCLEWQKGGLVRPAAVQDATTEYFAGEDLMGQWLADRCTMRSGAFELPAKLYHDWQSYAQGNGEDPGTAIGFGKKMAKRGLPSRVSNGTRAHYGVELRSAAYDAD
jgi:putative DNA primase/helicase